MKTQLEQILQLEPVLERVLKQVDAVIQAETLFLPCTLAQLQTIQINAVIQREIRFSQWLLQ